MPPPGMDMGMQYFMPPDSTGGMGFMDGGQHHHHAPGAGAQPQHQGQHPQQAQQQQLMLMQVCCREHRYRCFLSCGD